MTTCSRPPPMMRCLVGIWGRAPDRLVGLDLRKVGMLTDAGSNERKPVYMFPFQVREEDASQLYTMVLTKTMIFHRRFMGVYARNAAVTAEVDQRRNCEDIAMNAVVHNATGRGPLLLRGAPELRPPLETDVFSRSELRDDNGLSVQKDFGAWCAVRRQCVELMFAHFGEAGFATDLPGEEYGKDDTNYETCAADYANAHAPR